MKLSLYLVDKGYYPTRSQAHNAIKEGKITVDGNIITKDGFEVTEKNDICVKSDEHTYVSRGGNKLEAALTSFNLNLKDLTCLDIGASTGGFTDCMLQHGAAKVFAYDVGHEQLADKIRNDPRVISKEGINCRNLKRSDFDCDINFIAMDVSFISCSKMFLAISDILDVGSNAVVLFKPQFEVGSQYINKKGVVTDTNAVNRELENCKRNADEVKLSVEGCIEAPIKGQNGNQEYLLLLRKV